ncbi:MAG: hypothetical protein HOC23_22295 [Halieaceae bacterium]|jgi:Leucine-rich repeat (LRR) protein|nr:hypothetical protein [Halieaceae bacterium]
MLQRIALYLALGALVLTSGCESYDFTVNDRIVYTPAPLFSKFETADPALFECLKQSIIENKVTAAEQLTGLICTHGGISDLEGLGIFRGLTRLKLSSNTIGDLTHLEPLTALEALHLDNNNVVDPSPLYHLQGLRLVNLTGNKNLDCPPAKAFPTVEQVMLPEHCSKRGE